MFLKVKVANKLERAEVKKAKYKNNKKRKRGKIVRMIINVN